MALRPCRNPRAADYFAFYGADVAQMYLNGELERREDGKGVAFAEYLLGVGVYIFLEGMKTSVNQPLCRPLRSLSPEHPGRPRRHRGVSVKRVTVRDIVGPDELSK